MSVSPKIVLLATLLVTSPAIFGAIHGSMSIDTALERGMIGLVLCWVGTAIVTTVWMHNERHSSEFHQGPDPKDGNETRR